MNDTGNVTVMLSSGKVITFNYYAEERIPFVWGAGYTEKDIRHLCGWYVNHDTEPLAGLYSIPKWATQH